MNTPTKTNRRDFLSSASAANLGALAAGYPSTTAAAKAKLDSLNSTADTVIVLWLAGGVASTDTFDPKQYTPYEVGLDPNRVLSTFPAVDTVVDGLRFTEGLEKIGAVMDRGPLIKTYRAADLGFILHSRHQFHWHTAYEPPQSVAAPHIGSCLASVGLAGLGGEATGWKAALDGLGLLVRPDSSNAAAVGLCLFFVVGSLVQIVGIILSKPLADRFGKKAVFIAGVAVTTIATLGVFLVGPASVGLLFWLGILWAVGWGPTVPLLWVMIADVADYSEWKTSRRATGFMFAGILFALKAGLSLGGALSAWIIDAYGYVPNAVQSERALLGIRLGASVYPAIALALVLVCLAVYPIGKTLGLRIQADLTERRRRYQPLEVSQ